jgi:2-polyprenyl-3-methyl-5-hydroxy-6-metoxy-1,4-benzoquinol methylase
MNQEQPTRSGKQREARRFDRTSLHSNVHGYYVHRDYAAHFFRWGWVRRALARQRYEGGRVLDVGCGQEIPLARVFQIYPASIPKLYCGVDLNRVKSPLAGCKWVKLYEEFDFVTERYKILEEQGRVFTTAVCFEVIEHMGTRDGLALLQGIHELLKDNGQLFLSTPVFDGFKAVNHIHEWTIPELAAIVGKAGFKVEKRYGTFINSRDLKKVAKPDELAVYKRISEYYGTDVTATFLAPLYPDQARNNLWVLRRVR